MSKFPSTIKRPIRLLAPCALFLILAACTDLATLCMVNQVSASEKTAAVGQNRDPADKLEEGVPHPVQEAGSKPDNKKVCVPSAAECLVGRAQIESVKGVEHTFRITIINISKRDVVMKIGPAEPNEGPGLALEPGVDFIAIDKGESHSLSDTFRLGAKWKSTTKLMPGERTEFTVMFEEEPLHSLRLSPSAIKAISLRCYDSLGGTVEGDLIFPIWE
ncbi:hypothetical protein Pan258_38800 [Symmachiella dynata]|uniref:hypothetical protein n=1 Tax=Symmachiella dynata TaxID=2527995 RepID=UPI00118D4423|nr:hypothetical protein [Symmachiella dynata]QDT49825.1 hypothetical protein Pan258_38800 [Symmachiella dynata]